MEIADAPRQVQHPGYRRWRTPGPAFALFLALPESRRIQALVWSIHPAIVHSAKTFFCQTNYRRKCGRLSMASVTGSADAVSRAPDDSQHLSHFTSRLFAKIYDAAGYFHENFQNTRRDPNATVENYYGTQMRRASRNLTCSTP